MIGHMFRAAVILSLASVLLAAVALISCLSVEDKREIRGMPRFAWVLAILLAPLAGSIGWFWLGRPQPAAKPGSSWRAATGFPEPPRPRAPDDDPDFLRSLDQRSLTEQDERLLRAWEEDLKRREDEQRRRDSGNDT
jgi:hypothetical protein